MRKITKAQARKAFKLGALLTLVPSKANWQATIATYASCCEFTTFEDACLNKEHYYCNKNNGRTLHFYISSVDEHLI